MEPSRLVYFTVELAHRRAKQSLSRGRAVQPCRTAHKGHAAVPWAAVARQGPHNSSRQDTLPAPHLQPRLYCQLQYTSTLGPDMFSHSVTCADPALLHIIAQAQCVRAGYGRHAVR